MPSAHRTRVAAAQMTSSRNRLRFLRALLMNLTAPPVYRHASAQPTTGELTSDGTNCVVRVMFPRALLALREGLHDVPDDLFPRRTRLGDRQEGVYVGQSRAHLKSHAGAGALGEHLTVRHTDVAVPDDDQGRWKLVVV